MKSYEMVETLSDKAHVTLAQAKEALEKSNWDMLDAAIYLERNKSNMNTQQAQPNTPYSNTAPNGGMPNVQYVSSQQTERNGQFGNPQQPGSGAYGNVPPYTSNSVYGSTQQPNNGAYRNPPQYASNPFGTKTKLNSKRSFSEWLGRVCGTAEKIIGNGMDNYFVVRKHNERLIQLPVFIFIILLFAAFPTVIPVMVIGLFFGLQYSFEGKKIDNVSINDVMNKAANATDKMKEDFKSGMDDAKK